MKNLKSIMFVVFGFVLCFILMRACSKECSPKTYKDIVYKDKIIKVPVMTETIKTNTLYEILKDGDTSDGDTLDEKTKIEIQKIIDSVSVELLARITKKYYDKNYYSDSIKIDSLGWVYIKDTIQKNSILWREMSYDLKVSAIKQPNTGFLSVDAMLGGNKTSFDLGVGLSYTTRKRLSMGYIYNIVDNSHYIRIGKSIFNRKK